MNVLAGSGGASRRSPVEIVANAASVVTHSPAAAVTGISRGRLGRWTDGVAELRADRIEFAAYWDAHNNQVLAERARAQSRGEAPDPLWAVLGDSTAQGLGASGPRRGYVGQTLQQLRRTTRRRWRVLNLSVSGCLTRDVVTGQLPLLHELGTQPDLVTCGAGANDILFSPPSRLFSDLRELLAAVPEDTVMLDLPLMSGFWWLVGRMSVPYIARINRVIREVAAERRLAVAEVSRYFIAPWAGKFSVDNFHPSQDGYRDWSRALLQVLPAVRRTAAALSGWVVASVTGCGRAAAFHPIHPRIPASPCSLRHRGRNALAGPLSIPPGAGFDFASDMPAENRANRTRKWA
jgi:lysophospholipase L1-like esterase